MTCPLNCRAGVEPLASSGPSSHYSRCLGCGLAFEQQPQAFTELARCYLEDVFSPTKYYLQTRQEDIVTFRRRLKLLTSFSPARGRLLDVGCSTGTLMEVAQKLGWRIEGLEPNPQAVESARQSGFEVHQGFFTSEMVSRLPGGGYQGIVMSDVIEHLTHPQRSLRLINRLLAPGGLILVTTPNLESIWCRKFQAKPGEHLFLFNSASLRMLFERAAFEICHVETTSRRHSLSKLTNSTTQLGPHIDWLVDALCQLKLDGFATWIMEHFFKDELLLIARKPYR
ncbi:MAG: class I SAM-dependent methyltransferase [Deltaproteobacteria bacterium]|nr:class I SAM-dependent methyltransferase [Deltaproteobacteria bacterium]